MSSSHTVKSYVECERRAFHERKAKAKRNVLAADELLSWLQYLTYKIPEKKSTYKLMGRVFAPTVLLHQLFV
ncbi:hypothetical protein [Collinsella sp. An307]|uniref:hypothetical protein n=1 Tax=Collinsella sp. An307 TaxID=1965630 RepID=UPI00117D1FCD|nr:hypothetical protein [Collinsella sp. An307]